METSRNKSILTVIFSLIFILASPLAVLGDSDNIDWDKAPASLIHQKMAEGKAASLMDKKINRQMQSLEAAEDTQQNYDV
ncbi:MAG: hypothetical protein PHN52_07050, partial [candidate division Zixibacteria bacterium]|nr:hypothetical protein [candidate division Zixibacteria bacterium]